MNSCFIDTGLGFPGRSAGREFTCNTGGPGLIPGLGSSPGEGKGYPLQYSGLENFMDGTVHGVAESDRTERLSLWRAVMGRRRGDRVGCGDDDNVPFHYLEAQVFSLCETLS